MKLQRFVERLLASTSFSAFRRIVRYVSPGMIQLLVPIAIAGVACSVRLRGLQNLCGMLAGHGLSLLIPMSTEPAGYLMVPVVLFYFAILAAFGGCLDSAIQRAEDSAPSLTEALSAVYEQYIALFATTRALAIFQGSGQQTNLCILSFVYLLLPTSIAPSAESLQIKPGESTWPRHLAHCIQNLATRGAMLGMGTQFAVWAGNGEALLVLNLLVIFFTAQIGNASSAPGAKNSNEPAVSANNKNAKSAPPVGNTKLQDCHTLLSVLSAQQLIALMTSRIQPWLCVIVLAAMTAAVAASWFSR